MVLGENNTAQNKNNRMDEDLGSWVGGGWVGGGGKGLEGTC